MSLANSRMPQPADPSPPLAQEDSPRTDYLVVMRRRWKLLATGTAACGVLALAIGWTSRPIYEARASILVTESRNDVRNPVRPQASIANVRAMLESQSLAAQVIQEFGLDRPPYRMTPEAFVKGRVRLEDVTGADIIRVAVRLPEPELAARVTNRMAALGVELNRRVNRTQARSARERIGAEVELARGKLKDVEDRLLAFKEDAQVELTRKDVESKLGQRGQLLALHVEIETEAARLAKAEEELANRERILTVKRSIESDSTLTEAARSASPSGPGVLGLELREETINRVYETLEQQVAASRTKLSALRRQRDELVGNLKLGATNVPGLTQLYRKESQLAKLELERDLAKRIYSELVARYEEANFAGRGTEIQVIDEAVTPLRAVSLGRRRALVLGLLGGLMLSTLVAFLLEHAAGARGSTDGT